MNAATIHAAIDKAHLHVRHAQGHNDRKFQHIAGASYRHNAIAGIGLPKTSGIMGRVQQRGFFVPTACSMAGRGRGQQCPPMLVSVDQPEPDRHPLIGLKGGGIQPDYEQTIMSTSIKGTQPESCPIFILRATLEKRIRRELAKRNRKLLKSRPGTPAHREYGLYAIENDRRTVLETHLDLVKLARDLDVMQDHEYLDPHSDWRYYVVRHTTQIIDGKTIHSFDRLSRNFMTRAEAERFADRMKSEDGPIGIVGFDAREVGGND